MKNTSPYSVRFILRTYVIAVIVNTIVATAQVLYDKDFTFSYLLKVTGFMFVFSVALYAVICAVLSFITFISGLGNENVFWLMMVISIALGIIGAVLYKKELHDFAKQPSYIIGIAGFSIMVSLASQYQFFHDPEHPAMPLSADSQ